MQIQIIFNIGAITSVVNFDSPEGFTFSSSFEDVMKKYELDESDFSRNKNKFEVLSSKKITNDASYDFYVFGYTHDGITVTKQSSNGPYEDIDYQFNGKNKPTSYAYSISLSGKGYGKGEAVISAIEGKLSGYKKFEEESDDDVTYYSNENKEIKLSKGRGKIIIVIRNIMSIYDLSFHLMN